MPQLNLTPWLYTFLFIWLVFLFFSPVKILKLNLPLPPLSMYPLKLFTVNWKWPWR